MKVPPKRKGNEDGGVWAVKPMPLNESPSEKEGKCLNVVGDGFLDRPSMKVPPKRKGNLAQAACIAQWRHPSMKVPPKRKGNSRIPEGLDKLASALNESPSEKEGKSASISKTSRLEAGPSMKVPPKRKGNSTVAPCARCTVSAPQ